MSDVAKDPGQHGFRVQGLGFGDEDLGFRVRACVLFRVSIQGLYPLPSKDSYVKAFGPKDPIIYKAFGVF